MWNFIHSVLSSFRSCFSRGAAFDWFYTVVIGFMIRSDKLGITSVIRDLNLRHDCYEKIMHFFHARSWHLPDLHRKWYDIVKEQKVAWQHNGRLVFVIDGTKQSKEGHYMPGVKKMANDSDTQSKPQTMHGHMAGMLSILIGTAEKMAALPLRMNIQDGVKEMSKWEGSEVSGESHLVQMFRMTSEAVRHFGQDAIVLADRLFLTRSALKAIKEHNESCIHKLHMVTKCKTNVVAYEKPIQTGGRGRPRKKGKSRHLNDLFYLKHRFTKKKINLYGKEKDVSFFAINLLWGYGRELYEIRFVLVAYDKVTSILAATDLTMSAEEVIDLYAKRFRIEHLFRSLKQFYGGFSYHFWTKAMPRLNRYKKKSDPDPLTLVTKPKDRERILSALRATEMYLFLGNVAIGITMMISIKYEFDPNQLRYQRTPAKDKLSEENVMHYLRKGLFTHLASGESETINPSIIRNQYSPEEVIRA